MNERIFSSIFLGIKWCSNQQSNSVAFTDKLFCPLFRVDRCIFHIHTLPDLLVQYLEWEWVHCHCQGSCRFRWWTRPPPREWGAGGARGKDMWGSSVSSTLSVKLPFETFWSLCAWTKEPSECWTDFTIQTEGFHGNWPPPAPPHHPPRHQD